MFRGRGGELVKLVNCNNVKGQLYRTVLVINALSDAI